MKLPLTLQLKPSRFLLVLLISGYTLAGVAVFLLPLPWWLRVLIGLALGLLLWRTWQQAIREVQSLTLRADGKLTFMLGNGQVLDTEVAAETVVLPYLVIVHTPSSVRPLVIFSDALANQDEHRQLRVWLKWRAVS